MLSAGSRLGPYEIVARLGAGGMGEVYRARDARLGRDVAVKVLPEHLAKDPQALARFEREARAVAALSHPNILAIYDFGAEHGVQYAVTELLEGETLRSRLAVGPAPWRKAVEIAAALADGLAAAHAKGITHRDLKPENIFLTLDGRVKILDFGLARFQPAADPDDPAAPTKSFETQLGAVMGTVGYMAPEQVRGSAADARADIFALGAVLYEMLAGRRAFVAANATETLAAILRDEPPPLGPAAPAELARLLGRCLEKNPEERFQSARDLAFDLRAAGSATGLPAAAPIAGEAIDSIAVLPFANAGANPDTEYLSDGITENLINNLSQLPKLRVAPRSVAFRYKGKDIDPQTAGRELRVRALLMGRVQQRGETLSVQAELVDVERESQLWGERYIRKVADIFELEEEIARQISEKLRVKLTGEEKQKLARRHTEDSEAYQAYLRGRFHVGRRAVESIQKGIEYFQQAIEKDPGYALAYAGLAEGYTVINYFSVGPSRENWPKAMAAALRALQIDETLAEAHTLLGLTRGFSDYDWPAAENDCRRAVEINPASWLAHDYYAMLLVGAGRVEEAIAELRRAQELDPLSLVVHHHLALAFLMARQYDRTIEESTRAIELDAGFWIARYWMGLAYEQKAMHSEAIAELQRAAELSGRNPIVLASLAHVRAASGNRAEAQKLVEELDQVSRRGYVEPFYHAILYAGLDEPDRALVDLDRAFDERSSSLALFVKGEPRLDRLRPQPRFRDLLRRMRLV